ncbi:bifunctional folylpolyglutamate synthase/dihydrofolate synthase [bacterium]|nr:bifunctional folylpolyglutamate synthase/dihydrofolate synthase [FCB group bacterium]MBL7191984.1 bifunctional folylpolyglutamate synthase/dihydrofolate synthase [bacterium]
MSDTRSKLEYLYGLSRFGIKTNLTNITELCFFLGDPQDSYPIIHIAGTNGKGSTAAMLHSILTDAGYRCGLYTSPHLVQFGERIRINDEKLTDEAAADIIDELGPAFTKTEATFFEATTAMAFLHFQRCSVDIAVIEAGLGGSWDATNIIKPMMCLFTPISLDHTDRLGNSPGVIAEDKSGIIKPGSVVISAKQSEEVLQPISRRAESLGCKMMYAPDIIDVVEGNVNFDHSAVKLNCRENSEYSGGYHIPLPGRHQWDNVSAVVTAAAELNKKDFPISGENFKRGLERVFWPGRLQIIRDKPLTYYDVAHNPAAAMVVKEFFQEVFPGKKLKALFGIVRDKDIAGVMKNLSPVISQMIITGLPIDRSADPAQISQSADDFGIRHSLIEDSFTAVEVFHDSCSGDDICLITGSHYLGEPVMKKYLTYLK